MAQISVMESQTPIKSSAESFFEIYSKKNYLVAKMCPGLVEDVKLVKGEWNSVGSRKKWFFVPRGESAETCTLEVEDMNDKENSITYNALDGDLKKMYSTFKFTAQAKNCTEGNGSVVKLTLQFEKQNSDVPNPTKYFEFADLLYKSIDDYLVANPKRE